MPPFERNDGFVTVRRSDKLGGHTDLRLGMGHLALQYIL
jgi:hypothetical protein